MMDAVNLPPLFLLLFLRVTPAETSAWTIDVPSSVEGLRGSCAVIPCSFDYPDPGKAVTSSGIWSDASDHVVYHTDHSKIAKQYHGRTQLIGDVSQKNCSLKIDGLQQSDKGPFHFRAQVKNYDNFSYKTNTVAIAMISEPNPISFSVSEVVGGQSANASCSVSHSCPTSRPIITWSHSGQNNVRSQQLNNGQWTEMSTLTFYPTLADNNKPLQCTVTYNGGRRQKTSKILTVKYAPIDVKVEHKSKVKEGETVQLKCTSDAYPPANYHWHDSTGDPLHKGNLYMLPNVSRHTAAIYCTAINAVGKGKSGPVQLNVLYTPEIKTASSCSSEGNVVKCVCIAESKPPSTVHFLLSNKVLLNSKVESHGPVTIGILQEDFGSSGFVYCVANNTLGTASATLFLPINKTWQNIYIALAIGAAVIGVTLVMVVVKKCGCRRDEPPRDRGAVRTGETAVEPQYSAAKRKVVKDVTFTSMDHVYGNMANIKGTMDDDGDAVYANM